MRYLYVLLCIVLFNVLYSQAPPVINYQGVARSANGDPIVNTTIGLKFEILQGSSAGTVVFSEEQSVKTGTFGVFSVRIGTTTSAGVGSVNWNSGPYFLRVSIDLANAQTYTVLGDQEIVSVPFAIHAKSVPASFTNNILSVGNTTMAIENQSLSLLGPNTLSLSGSNTVEIAPSLSYSNSVLTVGPASNTLNLPVPPATSLDVTGSGAQFSITGVNDFSLHIPAVTLTPSTNVGISGTYPDFTVSATPSLSLLGPNTLSISGGNSVGLAPTIALNGNSLSVGSTTNFVSLPAPIVTGTGAASITTGTFSYNIFVPQSTITSGGGINIAPSGTNSFVLTVPPTTLINGNNVTVTGTNNNYVINAQPTLNLLSANTLSISHGNSVTIAPTLSLTGNILQVGPSTNTVIVPSNTTTILDGGAVTASLISPNTYSIHAPHVSLFSNNIAITGSSPDFTLTALPNYPTIVGVGVANVNPSSGPNMTVTVPDPVLTSGGNTIAISQGTANSVVNVPPPTLTMNNNSLSAGANTITIPTYTVSGSNISMTPGPNHTITVSQVNPTFSTTGIVSISPSTGTLFNVSVPDPVLSTIGNSIAINQGTASSAVNVPAPVLSLNNNSLSAGANTVNLPTPNYNGTNGILTTGTATTNITPTMQVSGNVLTVGPGSNTVTLPATSATIAQQGVAVVTPSVGNNFTVNVPAPTLSSGGNTIAINQGTANSTVIVPPPVLTLSNTTLTAGANTVTIPTPSYNVVTGDLNTGSSSTNITPSVQVNAGVLTVGPSNNSVTLPPTSATITQGGIAAVTPTTGNNFTVSVPAPVLSSGGNTIAISQGTANSTITVPPPVLTLSNNTLTAGANTVTIPTPSYNVVTGDLNTGSSSTNITPSVQVNGGVLTVGPSNNSVTLPPTSATITQGGIAVVTPTTGNNFNVLVPPAVYTASTGVLSQGTASQNITQTLILITNTLSVGPTSNSIVLPGTNLIGSGAVTTTNGATSNTIFVPFTQITGTNNVQVTSNFPNFLIDVPTPTITGAGMAVISPSTTGNNFVVTVAPGFTPATGVLGGGTHTVNITPAVTFTNNIVTVGPASNSVNISGVSPWTQSATSVVLTSSNSNVGIGTSTPQENLQVESAAGGSSLSIISPSPQTSSLLFGRPGAHNLGRIEYSMGANTMDIFSNNHDVLHIDANGNIGLNTAAVSPYDLAIFNSAGSTIRLFNNNNPGQGLVVGHNTFGSSIINNDNTPMQLATSGAARIHITGGGNVGIGTTAPTELLTVESSTSSAQLSIVSASPQTSSLFFGNPASHNQGRISYQNTGDNMIFGTSSTDRMVITGIGRVGIGNMAPQENLQVETTGNTAMSIISNTLSTLYFGNSTSHVKGALRYDNSNNSFNFWTNNTPNRLTINTSGNVGIGTATPGLNPGASKYLTVSSTTVYSNAPAAVELEGAYMGTGVPFAKIDFNSWGLASTSTNVARVGGYNGGTVGMGVLGFSTRDGSTLIERMRIDENGKVSIGSFAQPGSFQVVDGTQGSGKVMTSDATGNASWMDVLPAGMVMAYAGTVAVPAGWLPCDGTAYLRTAYPNLFAVIGTAWGAPSSTQFNVPDMRGMFLRGVDGGTGNDPDAITRGQIKTGGATGNNVGSIQQDQFETHQHTGLSTSSVLLTGGFSSITVPGGGLTGATGGQETRPKNVYVRYIIKY